MGNSVAARELGDIYQAMVFWKYAIQMFRDSDIEQIGYEYGKVKSFDDIVICYKKEQRFRDTYIDTDYIQVKFHVKQSDEFTMDNLLDPAFINAKTNSFLQNVVNAYKDDKIDFSRSRFTMYSVWRIRSGDILNKLISNENKAFDLNELQKGKTENSEMGGLRKKLCERLCVSESELIDILRQVRIKDGQESMESLKEILNREFSHYGLQPWPDSIDTLPYCDLVRAWNRSDINMVNVEDIRNYCDKEGFFIATKDVASIAIKSFTRNTEWLTNWASDVLDLADILNQRELRPGKSWEDVFQSIEQFVSSRLDYKIEYHVALETLLSVSFTVGRILNPKSGIKVIPVQKTLDGCIDWKRNDTNELEYSKFVISEEVLCNGECDMAVSIGITQDINGDVKDFIENSKLKICLYKSFSLEDFGTDAVKNGTHAWQLAKQINGEINRRPGTLKKGITHLFIAGPHSLMFYLGMQSMMYGKIQIYEFNRNENTYYPTISFPQKGEL